MERMAAWICSGFPFGKPPGEPGLTSIFFSSFLPNPTSLKARFPFSACQTRTSGHEGGLPVPGTADKSPGAARALVADTGTCPGAARPWCRKTQGCSPTPPPGAQRPRCRAPSPSSPRRPHLTQRAGQGREPAAGRPGARRAAIVLPPLPGGSQPPKSTPAPAPAGLSPERSVARGLPAFPWSPRRPPSRRLCARRPGPRRCGWTSPRWRGAGPSGPRPPPAGGGRGLGGDPGRPRGLHTQGRG